MTTLSQTADDYLRLRRSLGHKLADAGRLLPRLVAYLESNDLATITIEAAMAWAQQPDADPTSTVWVSRMAVARGFARHLAGRDSRTEVPPVGILPVRRHRRVPYIYSSAEIASLMAQARLTIRSEFRASTIETLFGLLAATGMRDRRHFGAGITAGEVACEAAGYSHTTRPNGAGRVGVRLLRPRHSGVDRDCLEVVGFQISNETRQQPTGVR
jgi:integrase